MLLSLEAFGNDEEGPVAIVLDLTPENIIHLLTLAETYRAARKAAPTLLRMVFDDQVGARYYVEDGKDDAIDDFVQDASGVKPIDHAPGEPNFRVDTKTIHVTPLMHPDGPVRFEFSALVKHTSQRVYAATIEEPFLRTL